MAWNTTSVSGYNYIYTKQANLEKNYFVAIYEMLLSVLKT